MELFFFVDSNRSTSVAYKNNWIHIENLTVTYQRPTSVQITSIHIWTFFFFFFHSWINFVQKHTIPIFTSLLYTSVPFDLLGHQITRCHQMTLPKDQSIPSRFPKNTFFITSIRSFPWSVMSSNGHAAALQTPQTQPHQMGKRRQT